MQLAKRLRCAGVTGALASLILFGAGCAGTTTVATSTTFRSPAVLYDYPITYVQTVPDLTFYPRTYYRGSYAYLVNGRWYYQTRGRWVVFREEPRELYRYRVYEYNRLEPPRRVRGAEYGTVPQPRPRYYDRSQPVPQSRERFRQAPAPSPRSVPTQRRTRQPAPRPQSVPMDRRTRQPAPPPPRTPGPTRRYER
jgi:hypothetical protein